MAYVSLLDMFDGGGAGASGSEFQGGPVSGLLNRMGVRPAGYRDRTASMGQMPPARPQQPVAGPSPVSEQPLRPPMSVSPVNRDYGFSGVGGGVNPVSPHDEALRFIASQGQPEYSGRGYVGMPINPVYNQTFEQFPDARGTLEYLRSIGAVNY